MSPRRVLHLIDTGGPGGAETIFLNLVTGLNRDRWESVAVIPEIDWLHAALLEHGIEPLVIQTHGSFDLRYARTLTRLVTEKRVSVIQTHLLTSAVYGSIAGRMTRTPAVCTFHGIADLPVHERFRGMKVRLFDRSQNRIVFVSESLRKAFAGRMRIRRAQVGVVWNGAELPEASAATTRVVRAELAVGDNDVLVGAIGNVRPSKAYDVLLRAAALLKSDERRYRFAIVGDTRTPLYAELKQLQGELGLEGVVTFTGFRADVHNVLQATDVFVLSSRAEGFSLSTVEALLAGVPVVATRCGGPEDIIEDGMTGTLVDTDDPAALADAIRRIATDKQTAHRMADAGRRAANEEYSVPAMVRGYEAVYQHALASTARGVPSAATRARAQV